MPDRILLVLPTAGHGGCEYNALSFAKHSRDHAGARITVCFPVSEATQFLAALARSNGFEPMDCPIAFDHDDDDGAVGLQAAWIRAALDDIRPDVLFLALPWPARGTGLILGAAAAGVPCLVKFALVPDVLNGPPASALPGLAAASRARQIWFANSHHSASLVEAHFGLAAGSVEHFPVGPIGLASLAGNTIQSSRTPALRVDFGFRPDTFVVVTVARLAGQKGYPHYLDAIGILAARDDSLRFLWVGEGDLRAGLEADILGRGLAGIVVLAGFRTDVRLILAQCDLFVLPSLYEGGCSQALLEAMDEGVPIVASRIAGVEEVVEDGRNGLLATVGDATDIARQIGRLKSDPSLRVRLAAAARVDAARLSASASFEETSRRLRRLLSPTPQVVAAARISRPQLILGRIRRIFMNSLRLR